MQTLHPKPKKKLKTYPPVGDGGRCFPAPGELGRCIKTPGDARSTAVYFELYLPGPKNDETFSLAALPKYPAAFACPKKTKLSEQFPAVCVLTISSLFFSNQVLQGFRTGTVKSGSLQVSKMEQNAAVVKRIVCP